MTVSLKTECNLMTCWGESNTSLHDSLSGIHIKNNLNEHFNFLLDNKQTRQETWKQYMLPYKEYITI